jgi:flagellar hook-length control protein FliK
MQVLKDSLEKQGLSVQGVSVSVSQDLSKGFRNILQWGSSDSSDKKADDSKNGFVNVASIQEHQQKLNPYTWSGSQIDLTA